MKKFNDLKIGIRLSVFTSLAVVIILVVLGVYIYRIQRDKIIADTDTNLMVQVNDLTEMVLFQVKERQKQVESAMNVATEILSSSGKLLLKQNKKIEIDVTNQVTQEVKKVEIPSLYLNDEPLYDNQTFVDKITGLTGAKTTIFQKIDGGYVRVSTSVLKPDGSRATNTFIPDDSPVIKAIERGKDFNGRAVVLDEWYLTSYRPLVIDNAIVGMLFAGMPEKDMRNLKQIFSEKKIMGSGYPFIVDKNGKFIIHPSKEGETMKNEEFFRKLTESGGKTYYTWEGQKKAQNSKYLKEIESHIVVSYYEDKMDEILGRIRNVILISVVLSIIFIAFINVLISRSITSGLKKGVDFAKKISEGDLTAELNINQKDEIGVLADSLTQMVEKLREIISGINVGALEIAAASQQISSGSMQLSGGANSQAAAAEEVSSAMEQMASSIQQNTDNAMQTEKISMQAKQSMDLMEESGKKSVESIKTISGKITIINDIAFQTNILALNAAVEAARAGEHGKGFAVVASEVRKLAERSKMAADEIASISKSSIVVTEESEKLINGLTPEIERTAKLVQEIAATSNEQNAGIEQVNNAIVDLNQIIQQNAGASEELATSAEELASQAEQLKNLIGFFKIDESKIDYNIKGSEANYKAQKALANNEKF